MTNQDGNGNSADIYSLNGSLKETISLDKSYMEGGFMSNGEIYFLDGMNCAIYRRSGRKKFEGRAETIMHTILSTGSSRRYIFVREGKTETIKLGLFS